MWLDTPGDVEDLGDGHSATVSADGRVVAFVTRLRPGAPQVIRVVGPVFDAKRRPVDRAESAEDVFAPALSADGQWIAYVSRPASTRDGRADAARAQVYVERVGDGVRQSGERHAGRPRSQRLQQAARDRRHWHSVVFESTATNIGCRPRGSASCDTDINLLGDIFLWDRTTGIVTRVNVATSELPWLEGAAYPTLSSDGTSIAFLSRQPVSDADGRDTFDLFIARR